MADDREIETTWAACSRFVAGMTPDERDPAAALRDLARRAPGPLDADRYNSGPLAVRLEERISALLGTEAAVWMPSGTMAQQIALRIHADRRGVRNVAFHPHCHLDVHEERGYERLHDLHAILLGHRDRLVTADDVAAVREPLAAVLLELPQRDLGGRLPTWDELVATVDAARARDAAVHMDGARLWQCGPFYGRPLDEIAALFDTVYVSFYKDLRAPAGCMLAGATAFVDEARTWLVRHGGRMFAAYPYLLAAERGLDEVLPRMPELVGHAHALGAALDALQGLTVAPRPPHAAMFHLHAVAEAEALNGRTLELARRTGTWPGAWWRDTPAGAAAELSLGLASLDVPAAEAAALYAELLGG